MCTVKKSKNSASLVGFTPLYLVTVDHTAKSSSAQGGKALWVMHNPNKQAVGACIAGPQTAGKVQIWNCRSNFESMRKGLPRRGSWRALARLRESCSLKISTNTNLYEALHPKTPSVTAFGRATSLEEGGSDSIESQLYPNAITPILDHSPNSPNPMFVLFVHPTRLFSACRMLQNPEFAA